VIFSLQIQADFSATSSIQSLFEILIFYSLDSNDARALYCLKADTVFRAMQIEMAAHSICTSIRIGL